jgi:F-type H+-transporting ATPase subunit b
MEIIQKFGLEAKLFLFQIVNFLIIAFLLKKFLYAPLKKILDERKHKIEKALLDAENSKIVLENANEERKKILLGAKNDADILTETAKAYIEETKEKSVAEAKHRSEQILDDAKQKAEAEFKTMSSQIGKISIDVSGKIVTKVLSDLFSDDEKQKLISRALEKIDENITN